MRTKPPSKKNIPPDDPEGVMRHAGLYAGGKALIVLGGYSAKNWFQLHEEIKPDVILGANGVNAVIENLDYWLCSENMNFTAGKAAAGDPRAIEFMEMFHREAGAKIKLISHWSWNLLKDKTNCFSIRRDGPENKGGQTADFSFRKYGNGFASGWVFRDITRMRLPQRVGNAGCQLLHMAGILGCAEVHTVGFDLMFKEKQRHHFYEYPKYTVDHFRLPGNFITRKGIQTQSVWLECAEFLKTMEPFLKRDGIMWKDHSDGLLKLEGLECAR